MFLSRIIRRKILTHSLVFVFMLVILASNAILSDANDSEHHDASHEHPSGGEGDGGNHNGHQTGGHHGHNSDEYCKPTTRDTDKLKYQFFPNSTKVGFAFVGVWLTFILVAKIMYTSSDQYRTTNKYDLVLFKPPNKASASSAIGPRRIYSNNGANMQNINAAAASGIDFSVLNVRSAMSSNHHHNHNNQSIHHHNFHIGDGNSTTGSQPSISVGKL